jgi:hypothetical protein
MTIRRFVQAAAITAVAIFIMAASASASTITWNTNSAGTAFVSTTGGTITGGGLVLESNGGTSSELTFTPNASSTNTPPTNVDFGDFLLTCSSCGTATFGAFTIHLVINDTTDGAFGTFTGSSTGGTVTSSSSTISISWTPLQLGPGTSGATSGNFGNTYFEVPNLTLVVAPNSGTPQGDTSIQGVVTSTLVPEPATLAMSGGALIGLALLARKRRK